MSRNFRHIIPLIIASFLFACSPSPIEQPEETRKGEYPSDWFYRQRAYPHGWIDKELYFREVRRKKAIEQLEFRNSPAWQFAGPTNVGGRITDVEMHPSSLDIIYIGAAAGGIFKSTDRGETWAPCLRRRPQPVDRGFSHRSFRSRYPLRRHGGSQCGRRGLCV
jgi:hypothetical protein